MLSPELEVLIVIKDDKVAELYIDLLETRVARVERLLDPTIIPERVKSVFYDAVVVTDEYEEVEGKSVIDQLLSIGYLGTCVLVTTGKKAYAEDEQEGFFLVELESGISGVVDVLKDIQID